MLQGEHHLVNRRWCDAEVAFQVGFGRRPSEHLCRRRRRIGGGVCVAHHRSAFESELCIVGCAPHIARDCAMAAYLIADAIGIAEDAPLLPAVRARCESNVTNLRAHKEEPHR